jgi:hypothetical protein
VANGDLSLGHSIPVQEKHTISARSSIISAVIGNLKLSSTAFRRLILRVLWAAADRVGKHQDGPRHVYSTPKQQLKICSTFCAGLQIYSCQIAADVWWRVPWKLLQSCTKLKRFWAASLGWCCLHVWVRLDVCTTLAAAAQMPLRTRPGLAIGLTGLEPGAPQEI